MTWFAVGAAAITAIGGAYSARQGRRAAADAANNASAVADPWADMRGPFQSALLTMLPDLLNFDDYSFEDDAGFKFEMDAGTEAINNAMGSQRLLRSGTRPLALQKFASGLAHSKNQTRIKNKMDLMQMLANLGGANQGSAATAGQIQMNGYNSGVSQQNNGINAVAGALPALANGWNQWAGRNYGTNPPVASPGTDPLGGP